MRSAGPFLLLCISLNFPLSLFRLLFHCKFYMLISLLNLNAILMYCTIAVYIFCRIYSRDELVV